MYYITEDSHNNSNHVNNSINNNDNNNSTDSNNTSNTSKRQKAFYPANHTSTMAWLPSVLIRCETTNAHRPPDPPYRPLVPKTLNVFTNAPTFYY